MVGPENGTIVPTGSSFACSCAAQNKRHSQKLDKLQHIIKLVLTVEKLYLITLRGDCS